MWLNYTLPLHRELEKYGFANKEPITYLGAKLFKSVYKNAGRSFDFRNWYLTMSDSDVF